MIPYVYISSHTYYNTPGKHYKSLFISLGKIYEKVLYVRLYSQLIKNKLCNRITLIKPFPSITIMAVYDCNRIIRTNRQPCGGR